MEALQRAYIGNESEFDGTDQAADSSDYGMYNNLSALASNNNLGSK